MTASDASIIAAIISSITTIVVALLHRSSSNQIKKRKLIPDDESVSGKKENNRHNTVFNKNSELIFQTFEQDKAAWYTASGILVVLLIVSVGLFRHEALFINFFILPVITLPLAFYRPTKPAFSTILVLLLYALTFMGLPASNFFFSRRASLGVSGVLIMAGLCFANVLILRIILYNKQKRMKIAAPTNFSPRIASRKSMNKEPTNLAEQLEKLRGLYKDGTLTDEEFSQAKKRLLEGITSSK
jgi:hypothetical protein